MRTRRRYVIVVDVTVPFEGEEISLQEARRHKEDKYSALKTWLMTQYDDVTLSAFVVGALGSWDDQNEERTLITKNGSPSSWENIIKLSRQLISSVSPPLQFWRPVILKRSTNFQH